MKPLTLEETKLKEEMKERCLAKGQYIDENAKAKFDMLCHLEDFEIQYWELQQENKQLQEQLLVSQTNEETFRLEMEDITQTLGLDEDTLFDNVKAYSRSLKDNWNKLKEWVDKCYDYYTNEKDYIGGRLCFTDMKNKIQELEQGSDE